MSGIDLKKILLKKYDLIEKQKKIFIQYCLKPVINPFYCLYIITFIHKKSMFPIHQVFQISP